MQGERAPRARTAQRCERARGKFNIHLPVTGKDEISRLSRAFNEMSAELEKARRLEADFLAIASHELRTPLTCILAYTHKVRAALLEGGEGWLRERPRHRFSICWRA